MPLRAILSTLILLVGTLSGSAASLNPAVRNSPFQPRSTLHAQVLQPAQARVVTTRHRQASFNGQTSTRVWQTPTIVKLGRQAFNQPDDAAVRPAVIKAAGGG